MNDFSPAAVCPLDITARLTQAVQLSYIEFADHLHSEPRLKEILWFLQYISRQPGSIEKFAADLIAEFPQQFGPAWLHQDHQRDVDAEARVKLFGNLDETQRCALVADKT